ncbi:MAG: hypothetical protein Q8M86_10460 [Syntrophales bacterium]|nr:hypothetical protein [Syntrophales bacterium]
MSKVFILGAGASREYSFGRRAVPLDGDFWGIADSIIDEAIKKGTPGPPTEDGGRLDYSKIVNNLRRWYPLFLNGSHHGPLLRI